MTMTKTNKDLPTTTCYRFSLTSARMQAGNLVGLLCVIYRDNRWILVLPDDFMCWVNIMAISYANAPMVAWILGMLAMIDFSKTPRMKAC